MLRDHGSRKKYHYDLLGMNSRLDSLQAAILLVKFKHLEAFTKARQRNADRYRKLFKQAGLDQALALPVQPEGLRHVYNQFVIRTPKRDQLREHLRNRGIPTEIYYPSPLHLQPAFADLGYVQGAFPQAEDASQHVLALPIFPQMTEEQQKLVVDDAILEQNLTSAPTEPEQRESLDSGAGRRSTLAHPGLITSCVYLKLLMYMYRVGPMVAVPPQDDLFVPQMLKRNGAGALGTASVCDTTSWPSTYQST